MTTTATMSATTTADRIRRTGRSGVCLHFRPMTPRPAPMEPRAKRRTALAKRLTAARIAAVLTQAAAADQLGAELRTYQRWEAGTSTPRGRRAKAVAEFIARHPA